MSLSADLRSAEQAVFAYKDEVRRWAERAEKIENKLIEIGSIAAGPLHDMPVNVAEALQKIDDLARDALEGRDA